MTAHLFHVDEMTDRHQEAYSCFPQLCETPLKMHARWRVITNHAEEPSGQLSWQFWRLQLNWNRPANTTACGLIDRFAWSCYLRHQGGSTRLMEVEASSETSVHYYQNTVCHIAIIVPDIRTSHISLTSSLFRISRSKDCHKSVQVRLDDNQ